MSKDEYKGLYQEQKDVIMHENGNILVSASAGSGKTFVMIKRIIRLITEKKAGINEILAMTFTEAAAKEMKEKLADGIEKAIEDGNESLAKEAAELPYADVCTIDSFCAKLIRRFFFKADVSPDFTVADAAVSEKLKSEALNRTFRQFYKDGDEDFKLLAKRFSRKRKDDSFKDVILSCYEFLSTEDDPEKFKEKNLALYSAEGFTKIQDEYLRLEKRKLSAIKSELSDLQSRLNCAGLGKGTGKAGQLLDVIDTMLNLTSPYGFQSVEIKLGNFDSKPSDDGQVMKKELDLYIKKVKEIKGDAARYFTDKVSDFAKFTELSFSTRVIYGVLERFSDIYKELKTDENVLDFNDLERLSLKILQDNSVADTVKNKYKYIFIDEYQDVNGVQEAILNLISDDNVFMVGDVKQSIYGFRGCRSVFFREKFRKMESAGECAKKLNRNFRSQDAVIRAVNDIFSYSMTEKVYGDSYKGSELIRGGLFPENSGRFGVYKFTDEPDNADAEEKPSAALAVYDVLSDLKGVGVNIKEIPKESRVVAKIIADEMKKTCFDLKTGTERPVRLSDIAILSRVNVDKAYDFVNGLKRLGVPVTNDGDVGVLDYPEVAILVALLKVLVNFNDDVPLATVMKSPFGNFTDEELTEIALSFYETESKGKRARFSDAVRNAAGLPDGLQKKVDGFKERIARARGLADFLSVGEILERLIADGNYYAFLAVEENGKDKTERVKFFVRKAFESGCNSLSEFVNLTNTAQNAFRTGVSSGGEAVKFMTIHSSKGLEYPVVILRGADKSFASPQDLRDKVLQDRDFGFAVKYYDDELMSVEETPLTGLVKKKIKDEAVTEEMRLFYVALTRAQNSLYVVYHVRDGEDKNGDTYTGLTGKKSLAGSYVNFLPPATVATEISEEDIANNASETSRREVIFANSSEEEEKKLKESIGFVYPYASDTVAPLKISVSAAMKQEEEFVVRSFDYPDDLSDTERGNTAHKIMELYDFDNFPDVKDFADELVSRKVLTKEEIGKIDFGKLRRAIEGGAFDMVKGKTLLREKNFIVSVEGRRVSSLDTSVPVVLQGKIDLLALDGKDAYVIDYKYSAHGKKTLKERYEKQLDLYAYAVEKSLNVKVKGKYIISLLTGETVKID